MSESSVNVEVHTHPLLLGRTSRCGEPRAAVYHRHATRVTATNQTRLTRTSRSLGNSFDDRGARVVMNSDQEGIGDLAYYSLRSQRYVIVILGLGKFFSVWSLGRGNASSFDGPVIADVGVRKL